MEWNSFLSTGAPSCFALSCRTDDEETISMHLHTFILAEDKHAAAEKLLEPYGFFQARVGACLALVSSGGHSDAAERCKQWMNECSITYEDLLYLQSITSAIELEQNRVYRSLLDGSVELRRVLSCWDEDGDPICSFHEVPRTSFYPAEDFLDYAEKAMTDGQSIVALSPLKPRDLHMQYVILPSEGTGQYFHCSMETPQKDCRMYIDDSPSTTTEFPFRFRVRNFLRPLKSMII
eukprot:GILK01003411.1.p1 GENE.GILK01003411.1~~GILK01003411.1.p1  ORF type:complete len:235 (-),score=25.06 GILK01003411.1:107-811(-)